MKKHSLIAIVLGALVLPLMVSCTKPDDDGPSNPINPDNPIGPIIPDTPEDIMGVYNPGKKIKKVYKSDSDTEKYLLENWNWTGNFLESIDHYDWQNIWKYKENYSYDDNERLIRIDYYGSESGSVVFEYIGSELKSVKKYYDQYLSVVYYDFKYQNGKLNEYSCQHNPNSNGWKDVFQLVWSGDNMEKCTIWNEKEDYSETTSFVYDKKHNPMKGFVAPIVRDKWVFAGKMGFAFCLSENNFIRYEKDDENSSVDFVYQYDIDGYPTSFTKVHQDNVGDPETCYFEYE